MVRDGQPPKQAAQSAVRDGWQPLRVLLAGMARRRAEALQDLLAADATVSVVGTATDATAALDSAVSLAPDLVLLDFAASRLGGLELARRLGQVAPDCRVILLGDAEGDVYATAARRAGAGAYLPWLISLPELLATMHALGVPPRSQPGPAET